MSILIDKNTRVLVQGLGKAGTFHAQQCREYGTTIVGAVSPEAEENCPPAERVDEEVPPTLSSFREGEGHGDADNEEEEGENHVGEGPAVPGRMAELCVGVAPAAGVIDQDHAGDRGATKDIEGREAAGGAGDRGGNG